jgi:hypothetical protein
MAASPLRRGAGERPSRKPSCWTADDLSEQQRLVVSSVTTCHRAVERHGPLAGRSNRPGGRPRPPVGRLRGTLDELVGGE